MSEPTLAQILLVEDHADTAFVMSRVLMRSGFEVSIATCGQDAIALVQDRKFNAILSDVGLPDVDGCDLLPILRRHTDAPAVALSAFVRVEDIDRCRRAGFSFHLAKPINVAELVDKVSALIWPHKAQA